MLDLHPWAHDHLAIITGSYRRPVGENDKENVRMTRKMWGMTPGGTDYKRLDCV